MSLNFKKLSDRIALPVLILKKSTDGWLEIIYFNSAFSHDFNIPNYCIGKELSTVFEIRDYEKLIANLKESEISENAYEFEDLFTYEGLKQLVKFNAIPFIEEDCTYYQLIVTDKQIELFHAENAELSGAILKHSDSAYIITNSEDKIIETNLICTQILGIKSEEIINQPLSNIIDLIRKISLVPIEIDIDEIKRDGVPKIVKINSIFVNDQFEEFYIPEITITPITTNKNQTIGLLITFQDISDNQLLEGIFGGFSFILDKIKENIIIYTNTGQVLFINQYLRSMFNISPQSDIMIYDVIPSISSEYFKYHWESLKKNKIVRYEDLFYTAAASEFAARIVEYYFTLNKQDYAFITISDITEEQLTTKSVLDKNELFNTVFNATTNLLFIVDENGIIENVNLEALKYLNRDKREIIGIPFGEAIYCVNIYRNQYNCGDSPMCSLCDVRKSINSNQIAKKLYYKAEGTISNGFGETKSIHITTSNLNTMDKERILISIDDITEFKKIQTKLVESGKKANILLNATDDLIALFDNKLTLIDCNDNFAENFDMSPIELFDHNVFKLMPPDISAKRIEWFTEVINTGIGLSTIESMNNNHYLVHINPILDDDYKTSLVAVFIRNISDLYSAEAAVRESEEKARLLIDTSPDLIVMIKPDGSVIDCNIEYAKAYNKEKTEIINQNIFNLFNEKVVDRRTAWINQVIDTKEVLHVMEEVENYYFNSTIIPIIGQNGEIKYIGIFIRNVTQLKEAQNQAEKSNKAKTAFLANMSHEIRTPLNAIIGFSEIISQENISKAHQGYFESIIENSKMLLSLINDILDISKIDAGKFGFKYEPVNIRKLFKEIKNTFEFQVHESKLDYIEEIDSSLPKYILIDELRLKQVLINIVGNAIKFTRVGSVTVSVSTESIAKDHICLSIIIKDTGIGISKDFIEYIFHEFMQEDESINRKYGGTGLGLTLANKFVKMMGGEIKVESEQDKGSTFTIVFPNIKTQETLAVSNIDSEMTKDLDYFRLVDTNIILADDNESNMKVISTYLSRAGVNVYSAVNGLEVLEFLKNDPLPSMILLDINMPIMNGYETFKAIKETNKFNGIPIIAITASIGSEIVHNIKTFGFSDYLFKPFSRKELIRLIMKYLPEEKIIAMDTTTSMEYNEINAISTFCELLPPENKKKIIDLVEKIRTKRTNKLLNELERQISITSELFNNDNILNFIENFKFALITFNVTKTNFYIDILYNHILKNHGDKA